MIALAKTISTKVVTQGKRLVKLLRFGLDDVQEAEQATPHGIDSNPAKELIAVYLKTSQNGKPVVVGFLTKECLAALGELRCFSTDENGALKAYAWFKNDGTIEFNGSADNLVRFNALNTGLQSHNAQVVVELTKIFAAFNALVPGLYLQGPVQTNINPAKVNDLKCTP